VKSLMHTFSFTHSHGHSHGHAHSSGPKSSSQSSANSSPRKPLFSRILHQNDDHHSGSPSQSLSLPHTHNHDQEESEVDPGSTSDGESLGHGHGRKKSGHLLSIGNAAAPAGGSQTGGSEVEPISKPLRPSSVKFTTSPTAGTVNEKQGVPAAPPSVDGSSEMFPLYEGDSVSSRTNGTRTSAATQTILTSSGKLRSMGSRSASSDGLTVDIERDNSTGSSSANVIGAAIASRQNQRVRATSGGSRKSSSRRILGGSVSMVKDAVRWVLLLFYFNPVVGSVSLFTLVWIALHHSHILPLLVLPFTVFFMLT
jgi:hypothetical protein